GANAAVELASLEQRRQAPQQQGPHRRDRDPDAAAALLQQAAALSPTDPQAAYDLLYPRNRTTISDLGPAFVTKHLYFAGGGDPALPCCILDDNVALALQKTCGWTSLPLKGWLAPAYQRYAILPGMWVDQHD